MVGVGFVAGSSGGHSADVATGEAEETYVNPGKPAGGRESGAVRAKALGAERQSEIANEGAAARWTR